jgi:hypothetical protein
MRYNGRVLTIYVSFMIICVCYMSLGSNGCFVAGVDLMSSHYRTDIISNVGHPRSNVVMSLVLCMVACNGWGTGIILQVPRDNANPAEKG